MATRLEGSAGRGDRYYFAPEDLIIIGLDTKDGEEHPLWDERIKLPVDDAKVASIKLFGVIEDVVVRRNGSDCDVVDGRQRVRAARQANLELKREGKDPVRVPVTVRKGDDSEMQAVGSVTNEQRSADPPLAKARKAQRMLDRGRGKAFVAMCFGVTQPVLNSYLALLDLDDEVQGAVERGELSASAAAELAPLKREEQRAKLAQVSEKAKATGKRPTAKDTKKAADPDAVVPPSRATVRKVFEAGDALAALVEPYAGVCKCTGKLVPVADSAKCFGCRLGAARDAYLAARNPEKAS
jgi:ParB family chromosome partitioning protein